MLIRHDQRRRTDTFPLQLLLATFGARVNREQTQVIDYLREENRVLKEQLRGKRLRGPISSAGGWRPARLRT